MPSSGIGPMGATIAVCVCVVVLLVICLVIFLRWQYKKDHMPDGVLYASVNPEYMSTNDSEYMGENRGRGVIRERQGVCEMFSTEGVSMISF